MKLHPELVRNGDVFDRKLVHSEKKKGEWVESKREAMSQIYARIAQFSQD